MKHKKTYFGFIKMLLLTILFPVIAQAQGIIAFNNEEILRTEMPQKENFSLDENIYARIYLPQTLADYFSEHNYQYDFQQAKYSYNYILRVFINDELKAKWYYEMPENLFNRTKSIEFVLNTDDVYDKRKFSSFINDWSDMIADNISEPGIYNITFDIVAGTVDMEKRKKPVIAKGSFELDVKKESLASFEDRNTPDLPTATVVDDRLEEDIETASEGLFPYTEPLNVIITDPNEGFTYVRDDHGFVLYRNIIASVVYKQRDGKCWVRTAQYTQPHRGYGKYDNLEHSKNMDGFYNYEIPCDDVVQNTQ